MSLILLLGACSWAPDWADPGIWFEEEPMPESLSEEARPREDAPYPNLASVPTERPQSSMTEEQRQAIIQQLRDQQRNARIVPGTIEVPPARASDIEAPSAPPVPSAVPAPTRAQQSLVTQQANAGETVPSENLVPTERVAQMAEARRNADEQLRQFQGAQQQIASQPAAAAEAQLAQQSGQQPGVVYAGQTPPGMVAPMAYNSGNYGLGTTVVGGGGATSYGGGQATYGYGGAGAYYGAANLAGVIYFGHDSTGLSDNDRRVLREIVEAWKLRGGSIVVVGHASLRTATTTPEHHAEINLRISEQRARHVANALRSMGVSESAIAVEAAGSSQPVYGEFMPTGEAHNRRVEIFLN